MATYVNLSLKVKSTTSSVTGSSHCTCIFSIFLHGFCPPTSCSMSPWKLLVGHLAPMPNTLYQARRGDSLTTAPTHFMFT